ncbi:anthranilate phosphoribosyltransferase [Aliiroseovarius crassostreae]|uniref:anthranilate phosphoribosyltransferase n=1 Tax=Aliiroseovarius crassostreae TaxID=154981 RepID=UPI0021B089E4|nr:anthranilate phosphoribosyltransferase [Aliiroseovarius crassostreae]UWQ06662.1 anthranilate phosphoribosyltransferase [Aliiroseovarius crassostreae]
MSPEETAAALIAGIPVSEEAMGAYWQVTDQGLRPKQETVAILAALSATAPHPAYMRSFVRFVRETYSPIALPSAENAINIVGTGGGCSTFNISTTAAFVVAAAGGTVLKSGSSAYSSTVGSGDLLAALGLTRAVSDDTVNAMLKETGLAFAAPQRYAPICKRLALSALPLGFKVIGRFVNALGPLICPYAVRANVIGASSPQLMEQIGSIAADLKIPALMVHAEQGVDEFLSTGTNIWQWADAPNSQKLDPATIGLLPGPIDALAGGNLEQNIQTLTDILRGAGGRECTETVALNAGAALYAGGQAQDLEAGTRLALECLREGAPYAKLEQARAFAAQIEPVPPVPPIRSKAIAEMEGTS